MPAPKGNRFAAKRPEDKLTASLFVRLTPQEKSIFAEVVTEGSVSAWARERLLEAARREQEHEGDI
jgi:hypothetical protein